MWIKLWYACLLVALVNAEYLYDSNPYSHYGGYATAYDNYKPTDYKFEYGVSDPHTGDHKSQWEVKENGVVRGAYSLLEADGTTRLVEYYADDTGFHADVKKLGTAIHDAPAHYGQLHPLAESHVADSLAYNGYGHGGVTHSYGAPIAAVAKVAAPIPAEFHAAPIAQVQHIAPIPQVIAPQIHHLGTPSQYDYGHELVPQQFYSAPEGHYEHQNVHAQVPVLQHPAPFKVAEQIHYAPQEVKVATPHLVQQYQQYDAPQIVKGYAPEIIANHYPQPQIVAKQYVEPQIVHKQYAEPQILTKHYAEPQLVEKTYAAPAEYAYAQPEYFAKNYAVPTAPEHYAGPEIINKAYAVPDPYYATPVATAKVAVASKVQVQNPFARFFAPLARYFAPPQKAVIAPVPVPTKVVPTAYYAEAPTKVIAGDYNAYQGYKPEVVIASPHNYAQSPVYGGYNHGY